MKKNNYTKPHMDTFVLSAPLMQTTISLLKENDPSEEEVDDEEDILSKKNHQEESTDFWDNNLW